MHEHKNRQFNIKGHLDIKTVITDPRENRHLGLFTENIKSIEKKCKKNTLKKDI